MNIKNKVLILCAACCAVSTACTPKLANMANEAVDLLKAILQPPTEDAPERFDLNRITEILGLSSDDEESVSGASSNAITTVSNATVNANWQFGPHLFRLTPSTERQVPLHYTTTSGGPVYAYAWYYRNGWQALGWQYNASNHSSYTGKLNIPAGSLAVYVGFFSAGGGRVTASLNTQSATGNIAQSSTSTDVSQKFNAAIQQARGQLGAAKGGITQASSINAQKQDFTNGIVILRAGAQEAYAIYGDIYRKWSTDGHTQKYGAPISAITSGRTINGQPSQYQLYDKTGNPSLHAWSKGVFHFNGGIRAEWDRRFNELGHPTSDETNGSQTFEKGRIDWVNNRAQVTLGNTAVAARGLRNADYQERWRVFDAGSDPVKTPQLRGGNASHNLSPAELIYYTAKENNLNPVLLLGKLQDEQSLIAQGKNQGDFEWRLARACGYGMKDSGDDRKYYGFYPQLVGTTFQFAKWRHLNFKTAYETFTTGAGKHDFFVRQIYPPYATRMNSIAGTSYATTPASSGYYHDFREISIDHIQRFLEAYDGALKERDLFRQRPLSNTQVVYP